MQKNLPKYAGYVGGKKEPLTVVCPSGSQLKRSKRPAPNDPCPCKSGKKYKKCCANKEG